MNESEQAEKQIRFPSVDLKAAHELISGSQLVVITTHHRPDGDPAGGESSQILSGQADALPAKP